jgi:cell fate (sporulation/competence/biofilm development) regulator YmcA (YheA/YmcA/DUF963 family)
MAMAVGDRLVGMIAASDLVLRLQELAAVIRSDSALTARYRDLLALQRRYVDARARGVETTATSCRTDYDEALAALSDVPVVAEYLALLEEIDDTVAETIAILNEGIARN